MVATSEGAGPHVDLALLGTANHMIANCVSSFSAFAVRARRVEGLPTTFCGMEEALRQEL